jgi:hypothetical protein
MCRFVGTMVLCAAVLCVSETGGVAPPPQRMVQVLPGPVLPDGKHVALMYYDSGWEAQEGKVPFIYVFPISGGRLKYALKGPKRDASILAFTRDDKYLLTHGMDRVVRTWDARTGKLLRELALAKKELENWKMGDWPLMPDEKHLMVWRNPPLPGPREKGRPLQLGEQRGHFEVYDLL